VPPAHPSATAKRIVLDVPSDRVRHDLDDAGVGYVSWTV
jgi:hypothetical protein